MDIVEKLNKIAKPVSPEVLEEARYRKEHKEELRAEAKRKLAERRKVRLQLMDKATQKAIEWQKANNPMAIGGGNFADVVDAYNVNPAFVAGYKEAEKDLALTWEDVAFICQTCTEVINSLPDKPCAYTPGFKDLYGEVLRRFNEQKKK